MTEGVGGKGQRGWPAEQNHKCASVQSRRARGAQTHSTPFYAATAACCPLLRKIPEDEVDCGSGKPDARKSSSNPISWLFVGRVGSDGTLEQISPALVPPLARSAVPQAAFPA